MYLKSFNKFGKIILKCYTTFQESFEECQKNFENFEEICEIFEKNLMFWQRLLKF